MRNVFHVALLLAAVLAGLSCRKPTPQVSSEYRIANNLLYLLKSYEAEHPNVPITNLAQLYKNSGIVYPFEEDRLFRTYGKNAGFTNSFYEKYVFLPPWLTNRFIDGHPVILNARPFPNRGGNLGRMVVSRVGTDSSGYRVEWRHEEMVQQTFRDIGIKIPEPPLMPSPPPAPLEEEHRRPLFSRIRSAVVDFLQLQGLSGEAAWTTWWILLSLPLLALLSVGLWMWRQRRE